MRLGRQLDHPPRSVQPEMLLSYKCDHVIHEF